MFETVKAVIFAVNFFAFVLFFLQGYVIPLGKILVSSIDSSIVYSFNPITLAFICVTIVLAFFIAFIDTSTSFVNSVLKNKHLTVFEKLWEFILLFGMFVWVTALICIFCASNMLGLYCIVKGLLWPLCNLLARIFVSGAALPAFTIYQSEAICSIMYIALAARIYKKDKTND
jgi:hypothetical protein